MNNLYDTHPPFQIDGNFGVAEGICEAIAQSHNPYYEFLPALPAAWKKGRLTGIRLRGNVGADIYWENGALSKVYLKSGTDKQVSCRYRGKEIKVALKAGENTPVVFE